MRERRTSKRGQGQEDWREEETDGKWERKKKEKEERDQWKREENEKEEKQKRVWWEEKRKREREREREDILIKVVLKNYDIYKIWVTMDCH